MKKFHIVHMYWDFDSGTEMSIIHQYWEKPRFHKVTDKSRLRLVKLLRDHYPKLSIDEYYNTEVMILRRQDLCLSAV